jgi:hypothetical protein
MSFHLSTKPEVLINVRQILKVLNSPFSFLVRGFSSSAFVLNAREPSKAISYHFSGVSQEGLNLQQFLMFLPHSTELLSLPHTV